ncbi:MAG: hypothetical protein A2Z88_05200 [Omnitrophica WOR_2 bacterium GWA2_47_8]|nr:MAG: hypothetical protein A2Z88_05200 [Omnitrophica WOR_2 bacterium GWA2_47_8]
MLTVTNLAKKFDGVTAVDDVSFEITPGEIFSLIGPNSSGKTTVVKSIAGLLRIDKGAIMVDGHDVAKKPKETKSVIGYIPDEPSVWGTMTGEEFLHFVGALYGMSPQKRSSRIKELLPYFNIAGIEKEQFQNYSRGNKQKLSILAAFLHEPKLILIDEPIVGLDPESAIVAKNMLTDFTADGGAVLLVTHTLPVAQEISTRIGVLKKGKLLTVGTLSDLRSEAKLDSGATLEQVYTALTTN